MADFMNAVLSGLRMSEKTPSARLADARNAFRGRRPLEALDKVRSLLDDAPETPDAAKFQSAVLAHLDGRLRQASRANAYDEIIEWATPLIFEEDYAQTAQEALLEALRQTMDGAERGEFLLDLSRTGPVCAKIWQEIGSLLDDLPPGAYQISTGFAVLRHVPGNRTVLEAITRQLSQIAFHAEVDPDKVTSLADRLRAHFPNPDQETYSLEQRQAVYQKARADISAPDPVLDGALNGVAEHLVLEHAIARVEEDFQPKNTPVTTSSESVWNFADAASPEYVLSTPPKLSPQALRLLQQKGPVTRIRTPLQRLSIIFSLWLRSVNFEASQDRIGYLWLVLDPLIHVMIICVFPLLLYGDYIADMEIFPFAVLGACLWLSCRMAATGALAGGGVLKSQLAHPSLRPLDIMLARAFSAPITYFFVGTTLLLIAAAMGLVDWPANMPLFLFFLLNIWVVGLSYGVIVYSLVQRYRGVRRINGFLLRFFAITSGLFYVTEQMPDVLANIVLWNPTVHAVQLARSAWFFNYQTSDGSLPYLIGATLALACLALACLAIDERRVMTVRA